MARATRRSGAGERLTLAYIEAHPMDAATVLERLPTDDAAALLATLPARLASPVLQHMLPNAAAECLRRLDGETAAELIRSLGLQAGAAVLRDLPEPMRAAMLEQLPTHAGIVLRLLLGYPETAVGAWMDPSVVALPPELTVREAMDHIRRLKHDSGAYVFVVSRDQKLQGIVPVQALLRATGKMPLERIADRSVPAFPARTTLDSVRTHPAWKHYHALPVVERGDRFVGALLFSNTTRRTHRSSARSEVYALSDNLAALISGYAAGLTGTAHVIGELFWVPPVEQRGEGHER